MEKVLYIDADREGYGIDQIRETMTVEQLIEHLEQFDGDMKIYLRHDNGYTYGGIKYRSFEEAEGEEEEEEDGE